MQLTINDTTLVFTVQYNKRKKLTLDVSPEGHIVVKAPLKTSEEDILSFVRSNSKPLIELQHRLDNRKYISSEKTYKEEELFLYQGKGYTLSALLEEVPESEEEIQTALKKFYFKKTKQLVKKRVKHYESIIGVQAKGISVVESATAWGTCNSYKELTFNYKLSMAPLSVLDYVVIHELCHILHMNHDRSFWRKVGMYDRDYEAKQAYLAKFGAVMTI